MCGHVSFSWKNRGGKGDGEQGDRNALSHTVGQESLSEERYLSRAQRPGE